MRAGSRRTEVLRHIRPGGGRAASALKPQSTPEAWSPVPYFLVRGSSEGFTYVIANGPVDSIWIVVGPFVTA